MPLFHVIPGLVHRYVPCAWVVLICLIGGVPCSFSQEATITNHLGMTFIRVAPGTFQMGSPETEPHRKSNEPRHRVEITSAFYLQETEVTLEQWQAVMGKSWLLKRRGGPRTPVTRVSFYDCQKFIRKLNKAGTAQYRIPTEAEWEYACRAGTDTAYSWGDDTDCSLAMYGNSLNRHAVCSPYYRSKGLPVNMPAPVKSFAPNPWGFYDMHGNVWEWCSDEYTDDIREPGVNTYDLFSARPRVRRGGSWYLYDRFMRSANRTYAHPGARFHTTGFRLIIETP
ncbi:MAG TPA: formylglycine-generating enzyme family protein [Desulfotignum sp.]|nr:formylglycine-generating enzyme family protein [Desulfotignum sp.]